MTRRKSNKGTAPRTFPRISAFLLPAEKASWPQRLKVVVSQMLIHYKASPGIPLANLEMVRRAVDGIGPDSPNAKAEAGARMVANMSSAHVPAFCRDGYKNAYDLGRLSSSQSNESDRGKSQRKRVDNALPLPPGATPDQVYFGAVELTGAGMRFYGDICLVLKSGAVAKDTVVLDRNSFDVDRPPAIGRVLRHPDPELARKNLLKSWAGRWDTDLASMATIRMHNSEASVSRRWTTGHIARGLVDDEDYLEVLKQGSFGAEEIQEARLFANDVAMEARIASRIGTIQTPRLEELIWRRRRVAAEAALRDAGIQVRVVTHSGRD